MFTRIGFRMTQRRLGHAVPIVGTVFRAGMSATLLMSVTGGADRVYRERFLRERYGLPAYDAVPTTSDREHADVIDVVDVLDEELGKEGDAGEEPTDA